MMPNITRGDRMAGLMMYLAGPGRANDHSDQHVVAGHDVVMQAARGASLQNTDTVLDLALVLDQPRRLYGTEVTAPVYEWDDVNQRKIKVGEKDAHVWHCSLSLNPTEGPLSDAQWNAIATDFVNEMGFTDPDGGKSCRWVAVRHGLSKNGNGGTERHACMKELQRVPVRDQMVVVERARNGDLIGYLVKTAEHNHEECVAVSHLGESVTGGGHDERRGDHLDAVPRNSHGLASVGSGGGLTWEPVPAPEIVESSFGA